MAITPKLANQDQKAFHAGGDADADSRLMVCQCGAFDEGKGVRRWFRTRRHEFQGSADNISDDRSGDAEIQHRNPTSARQGEAA